MPGFSKIWTSTCISLFVQLWFNKANGGKVGAVYYHVSCGDHSPLPFPTHSYFHFGTAAHSLASPSGRHGPSRMLVSNWDVPKEMVSWLSKVSYLCSPVPRREYWAICRTNASLSLQNQTHRVLQAKGKSVGRLGNWKSLPLDKHWLWESLKHKTCRSVNSNCCLVACNWKTLSACCFLDVINVMLGSSEEGPSSDTISWWQICVKTVNEELQ